MTLAWLGALSMSECFSVYPTVDEATNSSPLTNYSGIVQPTPVVNTLFSGWSDGSSIATGGGGDSTTLFIARTKDFAWIMFVFTGVPSSSGTGTKHRLVYSDTNTGVPSSTPSTGEIAFGTEITTNVGITRWKFRFCQWDGSAWQEGTLTTNGYSTIGANIYVTMQIQISTKQTKMWVNGTADTGADTTWGTTPVAQTPAVASVRYAGTGTITTGRIHELMMAEGDASGDRPAYTSASTDNHVFAYYPKTIGDSDAWTAVNVCHSLAEKWRAVRDPLYLPALDVNQPDDYIYANPTGSNVDQLFGIDFVSADWPSAVINHVYIYITYADVSAGFLIPTAILAKQGGTTLASLTYSNGSWIGEQYQTAPDAGAWTAAKLEALQVGVRTNAAASADQYAAHMIVVGVIGTSIGQPSSPGCLSLITAHPSANNVLLRR